MKCNNCNANIDPGQVKCPVCGAPALPTPPAQPAQPAQPTETAQPVQPAKKSKKKMWIIIILAVVLGGGALLTICGLLIGWYIYSLNNNYQTDLPEATEEYVEEEYVEPDEFDGVEVQTTDNPYSWLSERYVTYDDIVGMSKSELRIMRNAIFAMHGYKFKSPDLQEYFGQYSWYDPQYSDVTSMLSEVEIYNIEYIKGYE